MATIFNGFNPSQKQILTRVISQAGQMCMQSANALIYNPYGLSSNISSLLQDTFNILGQDRTEVEPIQSHFLSFTPRMGNTTFNMTKQHSGSRDEMGFDAFVKSDKPRDIFIVVPNFFRSPIREQALTLIHEYIHLLFPMDGHPGGVQINFARTRMGIEYTSAAKNPYCYQCFVDWLTGH